MNKVNLISYKFNRLIIQDITLPCLTIFSFLFYVFWTYPVQILSQELPINNYYIVDNIFIINSLLFSILLFGFIYVIHKYLYNVYKLIIGIILFFLIGTFLYKHGIRYEFGRFIDNYSLGTSKPILGYSHWFFLLDILYPISAIILAVFIIKRKHIVKVLLFFLLFYSIQNVNAIAKLKVTPLDTSVQQNIELSKNHKNILFYMIDSASIQIMRDAIENLTEEDKKWLKDFTFYDNVTALSTEGTHGSLPNMFGGYQFTTQEVLKYLDPKYEHDITNYRFMHDKAIDHLKEVLDDQVDIDTLEITFKKVITNSQSTENIKPDYFNIPILLVSLYWYIPYIFKNNLAATPVVSNSYNWTRKFTWNQKWVEFIALYNIISKLTDKPKINLLISGGGLHTDFSYPGQKKHILQTSSVQEVRQLFLDLVKYVFQDMNFMIEWLKQENIYDSTRIIITSDHGTQEVPNGDLIKQYKQSVSKHYGYNISDVIWITFLLPVFILDKNYSVTQDQLKYDSRFLSLGDIHSTLVTSFATNKAGYIDYLSVMPPNRQFNIPFRGVAYGLTLYITQRAEYLEAYKSKQASIN